MNFESEITSIRQELAGQEVKLAEIDKKLDILIAQKTLFVRGVRGIGTFLGVVGGWAVSLYLALKGAG